MDDVKRVEQVIRNTQRKLIEDSRARNGPLYIGVCLGCGAIVPAPKRWCGKLCHERWAGANRK